MDAKAMFNLSYGLFVLSANDGERDNACIINTAVQVANNPTRLAISCQSENLTKEMIERTGEFNVSVLSEDVSFDTIKHFGMQTGREVNKFENFSAVKRSHNGLYYLTENANAMFSCQLGWALPFASVPTTIISFAVCLPSTDNA